MRVAPSTVIPATNKLFAKDSRINEISKNAKKCESVRPPCPSENAVYTTEIMGLMRKTAKKTAMAIAIAVRPRL